MVDEIRTINFLGVGPNNTLKFSVNGEEYNVPEVLIGMANEYNVKKLEFIEKATIGIYSSMVSAPGFVPGVHEKKAITFAKTLANEFEKEVGWTPS